MGGRSYVNEQGYVKARQLEEFARYQTVWRAVPRSMRLVWCAGQAPDQDGALFAAGGTRFEAGLVPSDGLAYTQVFSVQGDVWSRLPGDPDMQGGNRWYPAVTKVPPPFAGGATPMLVTTGLYTVSENDPNISVELFDPQLGDYLLLSSALESPHGVAPKDYTHVFVLPTPGVGGFSRDEVLMFGRYGDVYGFNYSSQILSGSARFSARNLAPSIARSAAAAPTEPPASCSGMEES